jgi:NAD(P)-dependent dehydrogenase (short-subunit alcohol dehydrogenase family)
VTTLINEDLDEGPHFINLVMNVHRNFQNAMPFSPRHLQMMVDLLPRNSVFCVSGIGPSQLEANISALLLGGHARVGLEDNLYYRHGELATNVQLTERIVRIIREMDMEPATPAEAREIMGLPLKSGNRPEFALCRNRLAARRTSRAAATCTSGHDMTESLKGARVLVTAGAQGIGLAIARRFLGLGADVHICDVDEQSLQAVRESLPALSASRTDVSDESQVLAMFEALRGRWGALDVLVNNAGVSGPTSRLEDTTLDAWRNTLDVNLTGTFLCARSAVPLLRAAGGGAIVNISSVAGRLGFSLRSPYSASKFGLAGLTQTWAMELGPSNIRVNSVLPGVVSGDRVERIIAARAEAGGVSSEVMREQLVEKVSLRRMTRPEDVANQVVFLCSDQGAMISGQSISVCGNVEYLG